MTPRRAVAADAPAIARLVNLAYRVEAFFIAGDRTTAVEIETYLGRGAFLVTDGAGAGALAGSVYVEDRRDHGYIGLVSVDPALQRSGQGRTLMTAAETLLCSAGHSRAELVVVNLRSELPPWYRKLGYLEVGTRPFPLAAPNTQPCHYVVMSKRLWPAAGRRPGSAAASD